MVDPLNYFSFQPVLHNWCNKNCNIFYPVCGLVHIKDPLLLIGNSKLSLLSYFSTCPEIVDWVASLQSHDRHA